MKVKIKLVACLKFAKGEKMKAVPNFYRIVNFENLPKRNFSVVILCDSISVKSLL